MVGKSPTSNGAIAVASAVFGSLVSAYIYNQYLIYDEVRNPAEGIVRKGPPSIVMRYICKRSFSVLCSFEYFWVDGRVLGLLGGFRDSS